MSYNSILATAPLTLTGYHLKATGTTLGQSLIWDNGTNVGIGNQGTTYTLDVSGTGRFTGNGYVGGNLGVGTLIPSGIVNGLGLVVYDTNYPRVILQNSSSGTGTGAYSGLFMVGSDIYFGNSSATGKLYFAVNSSSSAMTITSAGNVGIGTSTFNYASANRGYLAINGTTDNFLEFQYGTTGVSGWINGTSSTLNMFTSGPKDLLFGTAGGEKMRITSGGFFKASNNGSYLDSNTWHEIRQSNNTRALVIQNSSASFTSTVLVLGSATSASASYNLISGDDGVVGQFRVSGNGVIYAQNTSVQPITSDRELKTDIKDYDKGIAEILAMKPRYFKYKDNLDEEKCGFIAQEMEDAIEGSMVDSSMEGYKTYQVDWYPLLVKAIQELSKQNEELSNRLIKLESK